MMKSQVEAQHYQVAYDTKGRFISYWTQIHEVITLKPDSILEVGVGNKFVTDYLRQRHFSLYTLDIAPDLTPDMLGSITHLPLKNHLFDLVMACQVLEHLPFDLFEPTLHELKRVSKKYVMISLPNQATVISLYYRMPFLGTLQWQLKFNVMRAFKEFKPDGQHFWEIGWARYPASRIINLMETVGFKILRQYRIFEFPYHHFFILQK